MDNSYFSAQQQDCATFHPGDIAYLIHSNRFIREITVMSADRSGMCSVRFNDAKGGIRVRCSRLFSDKEAAEKQLHSHRKVNFPV